MAHLANHRIVALIERHPHAVVIGHGVVVRDPLGIARIKALPHLVAGEQVHIDILRIMAIVNGAHENHVGVAESLPALALVKGRERNIAISGGPDASDLGLTALGHLVCVRETPARLTLHRVASRLRTFQCRTNH